MPPARRRHYAGIGHLFHSESTKVNLKAGCAPEDTSFRKCPGFKLGHCEILIRPLCQYLPRIYPLWTCRTNPDTELMFSKRLSAQEGNMAQKPSKIREFQKRFPTEDSCLT